MNIPRDIIKGRVYHKPKPKSYAYGCNPAAIKRAAKKYDGIDLDIRINKDGNAWCCHQPNPTRKDAWVDRKGIVNDSTPITRMTDADCARMHFQGQPMMTAERAAQLCKKSGLIPCFEAKGQDRRFYSVDWWKKFKAETTRNGVVPIVMSLPGSGGAGAKKLKAAHDAGLLTMWLWRNTAAGRAIPPFVDLVKSHTGKGGIYRKSKTPISSTPKPKPKPAPKPEKPVARGICPFAKQLIIPPGDNDPAISPRVAILHVDAGDAHSLYDYFKNRSGGIESHFHIRKDGVIEQYRDIYHQADANRDANDFAVSIETQGRGAGEWNAAQIASIKRLLLWLNEETKGAIPLRRVDRWNGSGIGYHTIWGSPSHWTPAVKSCPGPDRIKQFNTVIVRWLLDARTGNPAQKDELDMATEKEVRTWFREELERFVGDSVVVPPNETASYIEGAGKGQQVRLTSALTRIWRHLIDLKQK